jgi:hypothetical protein
MRVRKRDFPSSFPALNSFLNMSLSKYFRFGKDRNQEGNGVKKRMSRKPSSRTKPFSNKRKKNKSSLMSELLAEPLPDGIGYAVSFKKRPVIGKLFNALEIAYVNVNESTFLNESLEKIEKLQADLMHIDRQLSNKELDEDSRAKYMESREEKVEHLRPYLRLSSLIQKNRRSTLNAKTRPIRLRVVQIIEFDKGNHTYSVICEKV